MTEKRKIPLGSPVIIDTVKSKYNLNCKSTREIAFMPEGIVTAYTNELSGEFLIIKLRSNLEIKVSENELSECTRNYYYSKSIYPSRLLKYFKDFFNVEFILNGNRRIKDLFNLVTFLKWMKYTFKDII